MMESMSQDTLHRAILDLMLELKQQTRVIEKQSRVIDQLRDDVKGLHELIVDKTQPIPTDSDTDGGISVSDSELDELVWRCSPRQHAVIQMLVNGYTIERIADRLGTTTGGAKSQVRYLYTRLGLRRKTELISRCIPILDKVSKDDYLNITSIPKDWVSKYGEMDQDNAKKNDPYYDAICTTNYRMYG